MASLTVIFGSHLHRIFRYLAVVFCRQLAQLEWADLILGSQATGRLLFSRLGLTCTGCAQ